MKGPNLTEDTEFRVRLGTRRQSLLYSFRARRKKGARPTLTYYQQVVVKCRLVQARRGSGVASLKRHFSYLERSGVSESGGKPSFFSGEESGLSRKDIPLEECAKDPHHFRFIISPERGAELPLEDYTRRVMEQVEEELQLKL